MRNSLIEKLERSKDAGGGEWDSAIDMCIEEIRQHEAQQPSEEVVKSAMKAAYFDYKERCGILDDDIADVLTKAAIAAMNDTNSKVSINPKDESIQTGTLNDLIERLKRASGSVNGYIYTGDGNEVVVPLDIAIAALKESAEADSGGVRFDAHQSEQRAAQRDDNPPPSSSQTLNGITTVATYKWDTHTDYGFHCGQCGYDSGRVAQKIEKCPQCAPVSSEISDKSAVKHNIELVRHALKVATVKEDNTTTVEQTLNPAFRALQIIEYALLEALKREVVDDWQPKEELRRYGTDIVRSKLLHNQVFLQAKNGDVYRVWLGLDGLPTIECTEYNAVLPKTEIEGQNT